jgi:type VI secretion system secreted protein VgrG
MLSDDFVDLFDEEGYPQKYRKFTERELLSIPNYAPATLLGFYGEYGRCRPFNGLVTELNEGPPVSRGLRAYSLVLRPQMWLLSRRSDCRIWKDGDRHRRDAVFRARHSRPDVSGIVSRPPPQHYPVQWKETDLDYEPRG